MLKRIIKNFIMVFVPVFFICCSSGSDDTEEINDSKDDIMPLEIKDIAYPVVYANFQRNSLVPVEMKSTWNPLWSRRYIEINEELIVTPYAVQIKDNIVGIRSETDMLFYDAGGNFKNQLPVSGAGELIFGRRAFTYLSPSLQFTCQDYEGNVVGSPTVLPRLTDWAGALMIKPTLDDVLAAVRFSGGPMHDPRKYYVYRFLQKDGSLKWFHEFDGDADLALLTNDGGTIVLVRRNEAVLFGADEGDINNTFNLGIETFINASLDTGDNLLVLGEKTEDGQTQKLLKAFSLSGEELWTHPLMNLQLKQPPACGTDGRVYIIDSMQLQCIIDGEIKWAAMLKPAEDNRLTITGDNHAVVINGSLLCLFNPDGEKVYERLITKTDDSFYAPPAIDKEGRIFVAGQDALYCFE